MAASAALPEFEALELSQDGPVRIVTMNRPQARNALSSAAPHPFRVA